MTEPLIGRPSVSGKGPLLTTDFLPTVQRIMGIASPHRMSPGNQWAALPVSAMTSVTFLSAYGQWMTLAGTAGPAIGDWVEWDFGAIRTEGGVHLWLTHWKGPNLGSVELSLDGGTPTPLDMYASTYSSAGAYRLFIPDTNPEARLPKKRTLRMTATGKHPSSSATYILVNSVSINGTAE